MGELVNLNRFRKRAAHEDKAREAASNRARFGRSRAERARDDADKRRAAEHLDRHYLDDGGEAS